MAKKKILSKTRRANNEGSIFLRKDGRWAGYISIGFTKNGKPIRKFAYGKSQTEVAKKLSEISGRVKSNSYELVETHNLKELMFDWLMTFKKSAVTPRTFEGIIRNFKLHIAPVIGNMKVYEVDTYAIQRVVNKMIETEHANVTIKKNKHLLSQFFEYAIDNKWVQVNPTLKIKISSRDKKIYDDEQNYKAILPEVRDKFLTALNNDEANFIKPLCITMIFAGLRIGEAIALTWNCVDFEHKKIKVLRAITQVPRFDAEGNVISRKTVLSDTKTACSVRTIPITDIVVKTLKEWKEKQTVREQTNPNVTKSLTLPGSYVFANDDGTLRTYSGCRHIFDRFKKRNGLKNSGIHFHSLRHTFSNMLFELNENPKVIQQLLGHKDVKTTIGIYNSVNSDYVKEATDKLNEKIIEDEMKRVQEEKEKIEKEEQEKQKQLSDEEFDRKVAEMLREQEERKRRRRERDFEM